MQCKYNTGVILCLSLCVSAILMPLSCFHVSHCYFRYDFGVLTPTSHSKPLYYCQVFLMPDWLIDLVWCLNVNMQYSWWPAEDRWAVLSESNCTNMATFGVDELIVYFALRAVKSVEVLHTVGDIVDTVVAIEMHVLGTSDACKLAELFAALRCCYCFKDKNCYEEWVQKHTIYYKVLVCFFCDLY